VSEHLDGRCRCHWCGTDPLYVAYHDEEWGVPEYDDRALYEKLMLDGFQAGLAWITILRKREAFRKAFEGFEPEKIARYGETDVERLMANAGIVRSRAKILGAIKSARTYLAMHEAGTRFADFLWDFTDGSPIDNRLPGRHAIQAKTALSEKLSKELKRRGFTFCGPVIVYAFMQAVGMVNDHYVTCFRHAEVGRLAR
jgi:DNA-3-methyladenine glycosylase I